MSILELQINYTPHPSQWLFHNSTARFRILSCGRRWGKTLSGANEFIKQMIEAGDNAVGFCVAPTFWHTKKQWKEFLKYCPRELITNILRGEHKVELLGNREVWFRSCDNPDSLRSEGLDILWMDEGGQIKEEAWNEALRPALMDKRGKAFFTGTPKGRNWYWQLWMRGQDTTDKDYESWAFPSSDNPYIHEDEIKDTFKGMTDLAYRQEILAEFLDDIGAVFRGVKKCIRGVYEEPISYRRYYMGVDLAKHVDYTVICVLDENGHLCAFDRFSQLDWVFQQKRIVNMAKRYSATVIIDSTGVGDPIFDQLSRQGIRMQGYKFTNASKKDLIENLSIQIENKEISYPNEQVLINELMMFGYKEMPSGIIQYGAPENYHDDSVIALALAAWQTSRPKGRIIPI